MAALIGGILAVGVIVPLSAHVANAGGGSSAVGEDRRVLDSVPGFGMSPESVLRDDMIAYWEAWRRDTEVAACMRAAGFGWQPEVLYPQEVVEQVAQSLGVSAAAGTQEPPEQANSRAMQSLTHADADKYNRALYGESASDMAHLGRTGQVPAGRDAAHFAQGGCSGKARAAVGSVWDLPLQVEPKITAEEIRIKGSPAFAEVRAQYASCAVQQGANGVDGPEDLDQQLVHAEASGDPAAMEVAMLATEQVGVACNDIWARGSAEARAHAASQVRGEFVGQFTAHERRYRDVVARIRADQAFATFLSQTLAVQYPASGGTTSES